MSSRGRSYLDLCCAIASQPPRRITVQQSSQQVARSRRHNLRSREVQRLRQDLPVHLIRVLIVKGRETSQHLIQEHTKRPPIDSFGVALSVQQLGREVLWRSTESVCLVLVLHVQLAQAEIAERDVADVVDEDVLRLEIAVDDAEAVQALECAEQFGGVEAGAVDVEALLFLQMVEKLATVYESEHQVKLLRRLEGELKRHNEGVVDLRQY